jgi:hypothetical protein
MWDCGSHSGEGYCGLERNAICSSIRLQDLSGEITEYFFRVEEKIV